MKYVSIDVETTGLDPEKCQVIAIGAVIEDTLNPLPLEELPAFRVLIWHDKLNWEPVARQMNEALMEEFALPKTITKVCTDNSATELFRLFLLKNGFLQEDGKIKVLPAGKNFSGFDRLFLERLPFWKERFSLKRRALDPAMLYTDLLRDEEPPSLEECKKRAGIENPAVTHDPLEDALDIVKVLRVKY